MERLGRGSPTAPGLEPPSLDELLDAAPLTQRHLWAGVVCALTTLANGMATQLIAFVLPGVRQEWMLSPMSTGALASVTLGAMLIGSILGGVLSDRLGRVRSLELAVVVFGSATALSSIAWDYEVLAAMRFVTGLGLGAQIPAATALLAETMPSRVRARVMTTVLASFSMGWAAAAGLALWVIPFSGWRSVFLVAAWPLVLVPLIGVSIPESPGFLAERGRHGDAKAALRMLTAAGAPENLVTIEAKSRPSILRLGELWRLGYAQGTAVLWLMFFSNFLLIYAVAIWLPTLLLDRGYSVTDSFAWTLAMYCAGSVGGMASGWLLDRVGDRAAMAVYWAAGASSMVLLGQVESPAGVLLLGSVVAFFGFGSQLGLDVMAAQRYPTRCRATGLGWALGVGRLGALLGPVLAGVVLARATGSTFFAVFALPAVACLLLLCILPERVGQRLEGGAA